MECSNHLFHHIQHVNQLVCTSSFEICKGFSNKDLEGIWFHRNPFQEKDINPDIVVLNISITTFEQGHKYEFSCGTQ